MAAAGDLEDEEDVGAEELGRDRSEEMSDVESVEESDAEDSVARLRAWLEMHRR